MTAAQATGMTPSDFTPDEAPPQGFDQVSGDIVAYWEPASPGKGQGKDQKNPAFWYKEEAGFKQGSPPILFTPIDCVLGDSKLDATKTSTLLFGKLEKRCLLRSANEEEGYQVYEPGIIVGIWTKPGMSALKQLAGTQVWMANGIQVNDKKEFFKDVDKPSPMVQFDIRHKGPGKPLPVRQDRRDKSAPAPVKEAHAKVTEQMGDIPF